MASLEIQKGWYRIVLRHNGQKFQRSLDTQDKKEAKDLKARLEENLKLLERGRLAYQPGDDLITVLLSDGKLNVPVQAQKQITLGEFFARYKANRPPGKEINTAYTEDIHIKHLLRVLGAKTPLADIPAKAQSYVNVRHQETNRAGGTISHVTIKKELGTLSSLWNQWGIGEGIVLNPLSLKRVQYPKRKEQARFLTYDEVLRKSKGDPNSDLWESVFLSVSEVEELLAHVKRSKSHIRGRPLQFPFTFPMFAFVAYTGCRRSEMLRARVEDIDFDRSELTIREKKKDRTKEETYRHIPLVPELKKILNDWLAMHPGGKMLFSRKPNEPFTAQMASHHFRWAVEASKWQSLPGFHCLRHSLISNLAAHGVSDHVIMGLVGHINRETTRRYLHLRPATLETSLGVLFGKGKLAVANSV